MGTMSILLLIHSKYKFLASLRARKLLNLLERDSKGYVEWGILTSKPKRIDWKLVRKQVRITEQVQQLAMQELLEKLKIYVNLSFIPIDYMRLGWNVADLQDDLPCFAYRVYAYFPLFRGKIGKYDESTGFKITAWKRIFGKWKMVIIKNRREINMFKKIDEPFDREWLPNWMVEANIHY